MLLLSRRPGKRLVRQHLEVAVAVLAIEGQSVRLGVSTLEVLAVDRLIVRRCGRVRESA